MSNVKDLLDVYNRLNKRNRFDVLVFARFKVIRQAAAQVKPYVRERRSSERRRIRRVHWVGLGA